MEMSTDFTFFLLLSILIAIANSDVPRPRGVQLLSASLYVPEDNKDKWTCLDNSKTIKFLQINDDYCDCEDGSDEPGTSACPNGVFHCSNYGYRYQDIPSSRVNDGICDCCDGTDEYEEGMPNCPNTCVELGRAEQEQRRSEAELHKRGATRRSELINKGKQLRSERDGRRSELEKRRQELELIKSEKEELKHNAESLESEALEVYKEQKRERDAAAAENANDEEGPQAMRVEAEATFLRYDTNKDGFVEITELQVDMTLDRDRNGVVTVEEAKYFLDERDRIDLDGFIALSWPRIKPIKMAAEGLFKPPADDTNDNEDGEVNVEAEVDEQHPIVEGAEVDGNQIGDTEHGEDFETEEEEYEEEDTDADVGVGTATEETVPDPTEYDPETQRLVELANEARNALEEVERHIREIEHELKEIDNLNGKDYGVHEEYASLDGECFNFEDREYVYTLCPFDRASQKQRSGGAETTLGRWDQWIDEHGNKYSKQKYSHGASCWNGPQRSAIVEIKCALEDKITGVSEPNRCEYVFTFETPAACDGVDHTPKEENLHDEL